MSVFLFRSTLCLFKKYTNTLTAHIFNSINLISGDELYNDNRAGWDDNGNDKMYVECSDLIPKSVPRPNGG